jgi:hypothetical protein
MHLVTVKVKGDSSLLIIIIVSISYSSFGRGFLPLAKPKHKTP